MKCPSGLAVYFRMMASPEKIACTIHLNARGFTYGMAHGDSVEIRDENGEIIGMYERAFIAAILPLITLGPGADANIPS